MTKVFLASVCEHIAGHAATLPDKIAVRCPDGDLTYSSLWNRACGASQWLRGQGVHEGGRVLLHAVRSVDYIALYLAVHLIGAVAVPFEESLPAAAVKDLFERVDASVCISAARYDEIARCFSFADVFDGLVAEGGAVLPAAGMTAEFLLTTGTTGRSKVVMLTHGAVMSVIQNIITATELKEDNVSLVPMPLNHVFALRRLQAGLVAGATVVIVNGVASLKKFYGAIDSYGVTSLSLVPSALAFIHQASGDLLGRYAHQIRFVESSSAPLPSATRAWLREVLPESRLYNSYGCTESTACCMIEYSKRSDDGSCVGSPCSTAWISILDPHTGSPVEDGPGRIAIGGSGVMSGYFEDAQATASTLHDGLVYTNDLGYMLDGELYVQGRLDDVAIIGGHNVSPAEVEDTLSSCSLVRECACVKTDDPLTGDALALFIVWSDDCSQDDRMDVLAGYMKAELEPFKIPSRIIEVDSVPRTYNGKTDRKALISMLDD